MNRSTIIFFFGLLAVVLTIAWCNSRSRLAEQTGRDNSPGSPLLPSASPPAASGSVSPAPITQGTKSPAVDLAKSAAQIQPAVVSISVFEPSGKLLRRGTGLFVSAQGKILTTRSVMENAAHAIAKTMDNRLHNIGGILTDAGPEDLAVLNTEIKERVPFVVPNTTSSAEEGAPVAVVAGPATRGKAFVLEGTISRKRKNATGEWLELSTPVANDWMGAPVSNDRGEVIGLVTRGPGDPAVVVRSAATLNAVLARVPTDQKGKWLAEESPPAPAEGPLRKVPLAQNPQARRSKLVYSPAPPYPSAARTSSGMVKGSGRFRLTFDASGQVKNVMILRSTQNGALDKAAVDALRQWKAAPGEEWTLNVPITFQ